MKVTLIPQEPPKPDVQITLSQKEAFLLTKLVGSLSEKALTKMDFGVCYLEAATTREVFVISNSLFDLLKDVVGHKEK